MLHRRSPAINTDWLKWSGNMRSYLVKEKTANVALTEQKLKLAEYWKEDFITNNPPYGYGRGLSQEFDNLSREVERWKNTIPVAKNELNAAIENRKHKEQGKNAAEQQLKDVKEKNKAKPPELKFDDKIKGQMGDRGWTEKDVRDTVNKGPKGPSVDQRRPNKTPPDYLGRNDSAMVYGELGKYVVVNDRTG
ncbi:colicin E5-related ribonuclease, partial [Brenneria izbisi]